MAYTRLQELLIAAGRCPDCGEQTRIFRRCLKCRVRINQTQKNKPQKRKPNNEEPTRYTKRSA